jgi:hypothetical protein
MSSVVVCYFFQGELGESMETPNAFIVSDRKIFTFLIAYFNYGSILLV